MLQCEICNVSMICAECLDIEEETYDYLAARSDIIWVCEYCKKAKSMTAKFLQPELANFTKVMSDLQTNYNEMATKVTNIETDLQTKAGSAEVSLLKTDVKQLSSKLNKHTEDLAKLDKKITYMRSENEEIEKRKTSLVIRGLPEQVEGVNDLDLCKELLAALSIDYTPKKATRLGKKRPDGSSRHMRLELDEPDHQKDILGKAKTLKDCNAEGLHFNPKVVYIDPDLTKLQREAAFLQRQRRRKGGTQQTKPQPQSHPQGAVGGETSNSQS